MLAKTNQFIDDVYVSTDSKEIEKIAIDYGAKVIVRPLELAQDNSPEFLSWKHAVNILFNANDCQGVKLLLQKTLENNELKYSTVN